MLATGVRVSPMVCSIRPTRVGRSRDGSCRRVAKTAADAKGLPEKVLPGSMAARSGALTHGLQASHKQRKRSSCEQGHCSFRQLCKQRLTGPHRFLSGEQPHFGKGAGAAIQGLPVFLEITTKQVRLRNGDAVRSCQHRAHLGEQRAARRPPISHTLGDGLIAVAVGKEKRSAEPHSVLVGVLDNGYRDALARQQVQEYFFFADQGAPAAQG
jgi:hypothetical protein